MATKPKPLQGIKVLELARILAGPFLGQLLADLGAEVVKIESPQGDDTRFWGPPFVGKGDEKTAAYFYACNRGKTTLLADFHQADDLKNVKNLARVCDVVIENFKVGGLKKFQLDEAAVRKDNPSVIYCSISGFGQSGPYKHRAGYDYVIQAMSGFMDITGEKDGAPQKIGVALADIITALYGGVAVSTALYHRQQGGGGQYIDMALLDAMVGVLANQASNYFASGVSPSRLGNKHPNIAPYQVFYSAGGQPFVLACGNDIQFEKVMGLLGLSIDKKFLINALRVEHCDDLEKILSVEFQKWQRDELLARLEDIGVAAGPINKVSEALADPQMIARAMEMNVRLDGGEGDMGYLRTPIIFRDLDVVSTKPAPRLDKKNKHKNWQAILQDWLP
ncbi:MAG: CaiB/BaiF CoA transferase family protein [Alphaproteobacteria bacterium]